MTAGTFVTVFVVGLIAAWLAASYVKDGGYGLIWDMVLALVGSAYPMKVSPALLDNSLNQPQKAIAMVNVFSHSMLAPPPSALGPGTWLYGGSRALPA